MQAVIESGGAHKKYWMICDQIVFIVFVNKWTDVDKWKIFFSKIVYPESASLNRDLRKRGKESEYQIHCVKAQAVYPALVSTVCENPWKGTKPEMLSPWL